MTKVENPTLIATENMQAIMPLVIDQIRRTIEEHSMGEVDVQSVYAGLFSGNAQLWVHVERNTILGWAITQVASYDTKRRLRFMLLGGVELDKLLDDMDKIHEWSKEFGCTEVEAWVRPGLRKKLEPFGFRKTYEVVTQRFDNSELN